MASNGTPRRKYDIFVSFREENTCKNFTDHLFSALDQKGITHQTLEREKPSSSEELLEAIEASRFSIIVFSKNYASYSGCLDELVKTVECRKMMGQTVFPVFYDVRPSEVRKQEGSYGEAFEGYARSSRGEAEKVQKWRDAMTELANLYGWVLQDRHESELIQEIVTFLLNKLNDSSSSSPPPSSSNPPRNCDVFISYKEEDTRSNFTDHIFNALDQKGITYFRADQTLEPGKPISPGLLEAIEASRFSIIVFSKNYAASPWCLDEVVKIVRCMKERGQTVFPIFYDVEPSEVRKQLGSYEGAFKEHEETFGEEMLEKWKVAMTEVANLSGWALNDKHESVIIQEVVRLIFNKLNDSFSSFAKDLVGIESRLRDMDSCLAMGSDDIRFIGICGMGGIGKTTLAWAIYKMISDQFESGCFLAEVREVSKKRGLEYLQEHTLGKILNDRSIDVLDVYRGIDLMSQRLRGRRVLLILDDVDKLEQLEALAGERQWFGHGSRIIMTTRDEHLLSAHGVKLIYKARSMDRDESLELFSNKAFGQNHPTEDYTKLANRFVSYTSGLPLALKVLGSFLHGRSIKEWESAAERLQGIPDRQIFDVLKISFDGLEQTEKDIFLDIACFYSGKKKDRLIEILDGYDFDAAIGMSILIDKSLITEQIDRISMHSLLQEMGWAIVRQECPKEPGKRSRLWNSDDIYRVLTRNTGTDIVEGIFLDYLEAKEKCLDQAAFSKMINLRLLKIHDVQIPKELDFLSNELRILKWRGYPLKSLPTSFKPENLFELKMSHSCIEQLWGGTLRFEKLKVIKLSHSKRLTKSPNFRSFPNLEKLILEGCVNLCELHPTIGELGKLIVLNLTDCSNLPSLPSTVCGIQYLKILCLRGCTKLDKLPENLGDLKYLEELDAGRTALRQPPPSILLMKNLKKLSFQGCKGPPPKLLNLLFGCLLPGEGPKSLGFTLPSSLSGLLSLKELDLSDCNLFDGSVPSDLVRISTLKKLNLSRNHFVSLPAGFSQLSQLQSLELEYCKMLQELPELPSSIEELRTYNCWSLKMLSTPLDLSVAQRRDFMLNNCFELVKNHGDLNVVLEILKSHLLSSLKARLLFLFFNFLKWTEIQGSSNEAVTMLTGYVKLLMNILYQELRDAPPKVPDLIIFLSGIDIPDWFISQPPVPSVRINLPPNWSTDGMTMGLAICALFEARDDESIMRTGYSPPGISYSLSDRHAYKFIFTLLSDRRGHIIMNKYLSFKREDLAVSDHLWLFYLPFDDHLHKNNWQYVEAHFKCEGPGIEFKKCGIRMVYIPDIVELNQEMYQGMDISQFQNLVTVLGNFVAPTVQGIAIKYNNDANNSPDNQAEPS